MSSESFTVYCPYCGGAAERRTGADVRPEKHEVAHRTVWVCEKCDANAWCFDNTDQPNGPLANKELRLARIEFFKIATWAASKFGISREKNRPWIAHQLGVDPTDFRLTNLTIEQVRAGIAKMAGYLAGEKAPSNG